MNNTGTHTGHLWSNTGTLLASATFTGETGSGWQQVNFSSPVAITANTVYVASYFSPTGDFSVDRGYFATTGVNNPPLQALVDGGSGGADGVFAYGSTSQFPTSSYLSSNYWVDVVYSSSSQTTIWPSTATPETVDTGAGPSLELGVKFTASSNGQITGIRFYKGVNNTGTHTGHLWSNTGTLLASATFTGETGSGWQQVNFSSPVAITANTVYVASYFSPTGDFSVDRGYFATTGVNNPPLQALVDGGSGGADGVFAYGSTSQFPTSSYLSSNYWVDVVYSSSSQTTIWPSTVTPETADTGESQALELGVKFTASSNGQITGIRFYKGVNNTGTHTGHLWSNTGMLLASATFTGETGSGWQQVNFSSPVAITANTVYVASYFSPTGDFSVDRGYFATTGVNNPPLQALVDGGSGGADGVFAYGSTSQFPTSSYLSSNYWVDVVYNSTVAGDPPPTITTTSLPGGTQGVAYSQTLTAGGGNPPYSWTLVPGSSLPAGLTLSAGGVISGTPTGTGTTNFTVQVRDSSSTVQTAKATLSITITTAAPPPTCPCTIWPNTATPGTPDTGTGPSLELGVRFTANSNGFITGIRFYKGVNNTGTHTGHLWSNTGTLLASATFTGETGSGWQQVNFSSPVAITANTVYVASYFSPTGDFSVDRGYFATTGVNNPPLSALVDGSGGGGDGLYMYGSTSQFPSNSYLSSNYWVDVVFNTTGTGSGTSVSISPKRGGATINHLIQLTAAVTNDVGGAGVTWAVSGGGALSNKTTTAAVI